MDEEDDYLNIWYVYNFISKDPIIADGIKCFVIKWWNRSEANILFFNFYLHG